MGTPQPAPTHPWKRFPALPTRTHSRSSSPDRITELQQYEPLRAYLATQPGLELTLTFLEVEAIIDARLPRSAQARAWWTKAAAGPQTRAWLQAGWAVARIVPRPAPGLVTFVRRDPSGVPAHAARTGRVWSRRPTRGT